MALSQYLPRYASVVGPAGMAVDLQARWAVVKRIPTRSGGADFGAPTAVPAGDWAPMGEPEAEHTARVLQASWDALDEGAAAAPEALRKGPRGGGRDCSAVIAHVVAAERAYASKIGLKLREPPGGDAGAVSANRAALLEHWRRTSTAAAGAAAGRTTEAGGAPAGTAAAGAAASGGAWPPRYAARRIAWHILDHLWEIEDRWQ